MNQKENRGGMTVREAGKKGGTATSKTHGREFYQEIGQKGGRIGGPKGGQKVKELINRAKKNM